MGVVSGRYRTICLPAGLQEQSVCVVARDSFSSDRSETPTGKVICKPE